jgi:hypothetical protein
MELLNLQSTFPIIKGDSGWGRIKKVTVPYRTRKADKKIGLFQFFS